MFLKNKKENDFYLFQYLQVQLSEEDEKKLELHLEECEECKKTLIEIMITEGVIDQAYKNKIKEIRKIKKEEKSETSIEDLLSNPEKLYTLARDFLKENYPDEDIEEFDKYWNLVENEFDWNEAEFKDEKLDKEIIEVYPKAAIFGFDDRKIFTPGILIINTLLILYSKFKKQKISKEVVIKFLKSIKKKDKKEKKIIKNIINFINERMV